jgi:6,7-dimethyl-8-ribityllumazine synthase
VSSDERDELGLYGRRSTTEEEAPFEESVDPPDAATPTPERSWPADEAEDERPAAPPAPGFRGSDEARQDDFAAEPQPVEPQPVDAEPPEPAGVEGLEAEAADAEVAETPPEAGEPEVVEQEDPFAAWPEPQSGTVVEDTPEEGTSVEHVSGEIDVPDGYTVLEGTPLGLRRSVVIVVSRFNGGLTNRMLARALDALEEAEVSPDAVTVVPVPGAFELPLAAMALAKTRRYACVVALGAIVRGETPHFEYVASEAASGLQLAGIETGVPVAFGVLTVETVEQGEARIERAADAVRSALEMADLFARLRASAR